MPGMLGQLEIMPIEGGSRKPQLKQVARLVNHCARLANDQSGGVFQVAGANKCRPFSQVPFSDGFELAGRFLTRSRDSPPTTPHPHPPTGKKKNDGVSPLQL